MGLQRLGGVSVEQRMAAGTLALRPSAAAFGVGYYLATDDSGGKLWRSDGAAWTQAAPGVNERSGSLLASVITQTQQTTAVGTADGEAFSPAITTGAIAVGSRPIRVRGHCEYAAIDTLGASAYLVLLQNGVNIANGFFRASVANDVGAITVETVLNLAPGNYTFTLNKKRTAGTTTYMAFGYHTMLSVTEC